MTDQKKPSLLSAMLNKQSIPTPAPAPTPAPVAEKPKTSLLDAYSNPKPAPAPTPASTELTVAVQATSTLQNQLLQAAANSAQRANERHKEAEILFRELPTDFKELLDSFDAAIRRDNGVNIANFDLLRAYTKRIMTELREHPEFDGLTLDRDVHNLMLFVRSLHEQANQQLTTKIEKKEKKAAKPKASHRFDFDGIELDLNSVSDMEF